MLRDLHFHATRRREKSETEIRKENKKIKKNEGFTGGFEHKDETGKKREERIKGRGREEGMLVGGRGGRGGG